MVDPHRGSDVLERGPLQLSAHPLTNRRRHPKLGPYFATGILMRLMDLIQVAWLMGSYPRRPQHSSYSRAALADSMISWSTYR